LVRKLLPTYKFPASSPPLAVNSFPILGALKFFTGRWKFFRHARDQSRNGNFSFFLGKHPVVGLSGEEGRRLFFESREMGMREGSVFTFPDRLKITNRPTQIRSPLRPKPK
jgi:sterol 14-demethylase